MRYQVNTGFSTNLEFRKGQNPLKDTLTLISIDIDQQFLELRNHSSKKISNFMTSIKSYVFYK